MSLSPRPGACHIGLQEVMRPARRENTAGSEWCLQRPVLKVQHLHGGVAMQRKGFTLIELLVVIASSRSWLRSSSRSSRGRAGRRARRTASRT
ncbi:MAG: type II secretion system protein [Armatimonadota bacterium]